MSVLRHWLADNPAEPDHPTIVINYEWEVSRWQADGWAMRGPFVAADQLEGAVAAARAEQREATIRHAAEFLDSLGRGDLARALTRALGGQSRETNLPKETNP